MGKFSDRRAKRAQEHVEYWNDIAAVVGATKRAEERAHSREENPWDLELKERTQQLARRVMANCLIPARKENYEEWLSAWLASGNKVTHVYDYPFESSNTSNAFELHGKGWYIALRDFETVPLFGSRGIKIIVPEGVQHISGELGHTNLFLFADPNSEQKGPASSGIVPAYSDLSVRLLS